MSHFRRERIPAASSRKYPTPEEEFLQDMERRFNTLKAPEKPSGSVDSPKSKGMGGRDEGAMSFQQQQQRTSKATPTPSESSRDITGRGNNSTTTATMEDQVEMIDAPFVRQPILPQDAFFVQLKGFSVVGDVAIFTMVEEDMWTLYGFVIQWIKAQYDAGYLKPYNGENVKMGGYAVALDGDGNLMRVRLMDVVKSGGNVEPGEVDGLKLTVRDMDAVLDHDVDPSCVFEMPEQGLCIPFMVLRVQIDKTQLFAGTDVVIRAFQALEIKELVVFKATVKKEVGSKKKKTETDQVTLQLWTPRKENVGDMILKSLKQVCAVPVPMPRRGGRPLPVNVSHYTEDGEIYYQARVHQRKVLDIIEDFDKIIRGQLPSIKEQDPDYSSEALVKEKLEIPNYVFAAKYSEDSKYYRAQLVQEYAGEEKVCVHFIDYGNNDDNVHISNIVLLELFDGVLMHLPPMARPVKLQGVDYLDPEKMDSVLEQYAKFKIKVLSTDPLFTAELLVDTSTGSDPAKEKLVLIQDILKTKI